MNLIKAIVQTCQNISGWRREKREKEEKDRRLEQRKREWQRQEMEREAEMAAKLAHSEKTCQKITEVRMEGFREPDPTLRPCDIKITAPESEPYGIDLFFDRPNVTWAFYSYASGMDERAYFPQIDDWSKPVVNYSVDEKGRCCEDGFKLYGDETYHLSVCFAAQPGYIFAEDVTLFVNGEKVQMGPESVWDPPRTTYYYGGFRWCRDPENYALFWIFWTTPHVCPICW